MCWYYECYKRGSIDSRFLDFIHKQREKKRIVDDVSFRAYAKRSTIKLLSWLRETERGVDFNYRSIVQKAYKSDRFRRHDCAFTDIDAGIQGQSMLVSFNPLCSGRNTSVKRRNSHNTSAFVFLAVTITYLTWMGRIDGPFAWPSVNATRRRLTICFQL